MYPDMYVRFNHQLQENTCQRNLTVDANLGSFFAVDMG